MITNPLFNNFQNTLEQETLDSLIVEAIKVYGQDMYYIPRTEVNYDGIYGEDDVSKYELAYLFEIYIKSIDGFGGQGSFLSKFGLEIRDQVTFSIARKTFEMEVQKDNETITRPREGDLIYFPLNKKCFEIKYVDNKPFFYQFGTLQMYDVQCELFEYSNEIFNTGIEEIDEIQQKFSFNAYDYALEANTDLALATGDDAILTTQDYIDIPETYDPLADNNRIETESARDTSDTLINWDEKNPFGGASDGKY